MDNQGASASQTGPSQAEPVVSAVPASVPCAWIPVDPTNPPALHMVAIYNDGCGAVTLTKFDNSGFLMPEDAFEMGADDVARSFSWWTPAPDGFVPHFMEVTPDDWF